MRLCSSTPRRASEREPKTEERRQLLLRRQTTAHPHPHPPGRATPPSLSLRERRETGCAGRRSGNCALSVPPPRAMEAKSVFSLQKALAQPVKMCMFDFPVSILDDLVSQRAVNKPSLAQGLHWSR
ncbi:hypothetical protein MATL_G00057450 [Megalops atlanticus]|uniref:Uncharacterized protein n=1 Tax=Megalops atlanticus TaxID=7932 RepID=A0A9D3T913_MEGAT|nr:hypothetical protein MATL_G00057450 [Megalops atlanticus]